MRATIVGYNGWDVTRAEVNYCVFIYLSFITAGTLLHFNIKMSPAPLNTAPDQLLRTVDVILITAQQCTGRKWVLAD